MDLNINYFKAVQNTSGLNSAQSAIIQDSKTRIVSDMTTSINYKEFAMKNGNLNPVVISTGKTSYKCVVICLPGDTLYAGDMISSDGNAWLIVDVNTTNPIQVSGTGWLCNQKFRFQNGTTKIIEKYGVIDNGTYSKTKDDQIVVLNNSYKIYLPYDDDTKKIYTDKRLATNIAYDKYGNQSLTCYKVTSADPVSQSYGKGGHLLVVPIISDAYSEATDNLTELICDYISESNSGGTSVSTLLNCAITTARDTIRTGTSYTFVATFYKANGTTIDDDVEASWSTSTVPSGITFTPNGSLMKVSIAENDALIGESFTLTVTDTGSLYNTATYTVEVI